MEVNIEATCLGDSHWSKGIGLIVTIYKLELEYVNDKKTFGELCAYFTESSWNTSKNGFIYTDSGWIHDFCNALQTLGFSKTATNDIDYSEQGMQGTDYVSMDVGKSFIKEWNNIT